jgi:purine nucleoside permease
MPRLLMLLMSALLAACGQNATETSDTLSSDTRLPVKVVIVTMFETGEIAGDAAGEFQRWHERRQLSTVYPAPHMHRDIYANVGDGVIGIITGMGTANAAASVTALGLDPRFDLSKAYWLVAGISGFDPHAASLGSVAWADYLVDGDLAHEIDAREIPAEWSDGYFPLFSQGPEDRGRLAYKDLGEVFQLNTALVDWAYALTRDMALPDDPNLEATRVLYDGFPKAQEKPKVIRGDQLAAMTFWHGEKLNAWAQRWVKFWTQDKGTFVSSAMEDTGTYQALTYLDRAGLVDKDRVLVLRTASNFTMPPPGKGAADYLREEQHDSYAGLDAALENAYLVGNTVIEELVSNWTRYRQGVTTSAR